MIEMELNKIRIDENREGQVIVLKEKKGERFLPIVIGITEIVAIKRKLSDVQLPRPMTHDLLASIIVELEGKIERIVIDKLANDTFYAKIVIRTKSGEAKQIDARPSDSIALALRANAPIYVEEDVLKEYQKLGGAAF